ncbi:hypothetical protein [Dyella sp. Tek66A03]|uniref:hypothetical protein n=1 Tax=Dyella sp. Tek66A03 TaxID=3458298 RepID=UPI00403E8637
MKAGIAVLAGVIVLSTTACTQKVDAVGCKSTSDLVAIRALKLESAENDAASDSNKGDHRLLGIHSGVGLMVPGLATNPDTSGYGLRIVEGTDTPCSPEESALNTRALRYARKYNEKKMLLWRPQPS